MKKFLMTLAMAAAMVFSFRRKRPSKSQLIAHASHKYIEIRVGNGNEQIARMNK